MLEIRNLRFSYEDYAVIDDLNWQLDAAGVHGLVGLNGCGKTTLLNIMYGFLKPQVGKISWNDSPLKRSEIGYLETINYFYSNITGLEYLSLFPNHGRAFPLDIWQELLQIPLEDLIDHYSTGMKKKLALLGVIKLNRPIFLLDEPFNGLDLESNRILKLLISRLKNSGHTIIITSHILESLITVCDTVSYLKLGHIDRIFLKNELHAVEEAVFKDSHHQVQTLLDQAMNF